MNRREKIIGLILMAIFFIWLNSVMSKKHIRIKETSDNLVSPIPAGKKISRAKEPDESVKKIDMKDVLSRFEVESSASKAGITIDPFKKLERKVDLTESAFSDLVLSGIIGGDEALVVINGQILKRGDEVLGYLIESISEREVTIYKNGERKVLKLLEEDTIKE